MLKDYGRHILWIDYFNSSCSRADGRKLPLNRCVKNPTLQELIQAASSLNYNPEASEAFHPKRSHQKSGYMSVQKRKKKVEVLQEISFALASLRGEKKSPQ